MICHIFTRTAPALPFSPAPHPYPHFTRTRTRTRTDFVYTRYVSFLCKKYEHSNQNVVMPIYQILKLLAFVRMSVAILINNMSYIKTCIWTVYNSKEAIRIFFFFSAILIFFYLLKYFASMVAKLLFCNDNVLSFSRSALQ